MHPEILNDKPNEILYQMIKRTATIYTILNKQQIIKIYLFSRSSNLGLAGTSDLLHSVLPFLTLFPCLLMLLKQSVPGKPMFRFELLSEVQGVVDEGKASRFATTEIRLETEHEDDIRRNLVHLAELLTDLGFANRGLSRMQNIDDLYKGRRPS